MILCFGIKRFFPVGFRFHLLLIVAFPHTVLSSGLRKRQQLIQANLILTLNKYYEKLLYLPYAKVSGFSVIHVYNLLV